MVTLLVCVIGAIFGYSDWLERPLAITLSHKLQLLIPDGGAVNINDLGGIIVLGGSPTRIQAGIDLGMRYPGAAILLSGPTDYEVQLALAQFGVSDRLMIDRRAKNTYENAFYSKGILSGRSGETWLVVTSAIHMPRALGVFEANGLCVVPWPVEDLPLNSADSARLVWKSGE